jgi:hypothetical protein
MWRMTAVAILCAGLLPLSAAGQPQPAGAFDQPSAFWAGPAMSGSWYAADRSGEGIILQVLADGTAVAFWFTYPPAGVAGAQAWLVAQGGALDGDTVRFDQVYRPQGTRFGDGFDQAAVVHQPWGRLSLQFSDCSTAQLRYEGPAGWGAGERTLVRLTALDQLDCAGHSRSLLANGAPAAAALHGHSAAWYTPGRAGEGWIVEHLPGGLVALYWFTFGVDGDQAWIVALGTLEDGQAELAAQVTEGTRFGAAFDAAAVQRIPWGSITLRWESCDALALDYASQLPGYGDGARAAVRLVTLASLPCRRTLPAPTSTGSFTEHARMPDPPQSELAVAGTATGLYTLGGFGGPRSFKHHAYASGIWSVLPELPAGRHHLAAFVLDGAVYMHGGVPVGGGDQSTAMFRYDPSSRQWAPVAGPVFSAASHAAVLNGRAYIGSASGQLQEFDARHGRVRTLPIAPGQRDHSQLVAFLGELWLIGGRSPETGSVAIWNPASETWRDGPVLNRPRGGFAAAVVDDRIWVAGGEVLQPALFIEPSTESYSAGSDGWLRGPDLPAPVHGVGGAGHEGRFYVVSGSTEAGAARGATGRLFSLQPGD